MRRSAPLTFRWLVAGIVAVLMLLGGSMRPSAIDALRIRAALEHVERKADGGERAHLDRSSDSRVSAGRPSGGPDTATDDGPALRSFVPPLPARHVASPRESDPSRRLDATVRRVRPHVENMVFLI